MWLACFVCAGIAIRAGAGCQGDKCIFQGNHLIGSSIVGCAASGQTAAIAFYFTTKPMPAWDSNQVGFVASRGHVGCMRTSVVVHWEGVLEICTFCPSVLNNFLIAAV